jgi:hypothetical protein
MVSTAISHGERLCKKGGTAYQRLLRPFLLSPFPFEEPLCYVVGFSWGMKVSQVFDQDVTCGLGSSTEFGSFCFGMHLNYVLQKTQ